MIFTAGQFRAARALLELTQRDAAKGIGVSEPTVKRMENDAIGPMKSKAELVNRVRGFFESHDVVFLDQGDGFKEGVALRDDGDEPQLPMNRKRKD